MSFDVQISNASPLDGSVTKKMTVETTRMNGIVVTIRAYRILHYDSVGTLVCIFCTLTYSILILLMGKIVRDIFSFLLKQGFSV